jgi:cytochrome c oxidase cbb3-type subunit 2
MMSMTIGRPPATEPEPGAEAPPPTLVVGVEPGPEPSGLGFVRVAFLLVLPLAAAAYVYLAATGITSVVEPPRRAAAPVAQAQAPERDGAALYVHHCARCHGVRGEADGFASPFLQPWARKFGQEKFQLASTTNGVPTDDDLVSVIARGIPGTAMPPFDFLSEPEKRAVARHVRRLSYEGLYEKLWKRFEADGEDPDPREVHAMTAKQLAVGPTLPIPPELNGSSPEAVARGKKTFLANCATCHGPEGKGDGPQVKDMKRDNGQPIRPRDLARGIFAGGGEADRLYRRIALGMPGTPMPASATLKPTEIADLVYFVQSLSLQPAGNGTGQ